MKIFHCQCGNRVFFDNTVCQVCRRQLGFDPVRQDMIALDAEPSGRLTAPDGAGYRRCGNAHRYENCNWLIAQRESGELCFSCRMNEVIPALDRPGNLQLWSRIESAKRRLLYSLLALDLPVAGDRALKFRFMEDHRRNPDVFEDFVTTGHFASTITINISEADDVARHQARQQMNERYRTVLGHLRHEYAHFYFPLVMDSPDSLEECRHLFGDERIDYRQALAVHYDQGPPPDWPEKFVSAYASSHPAEDFAETFAHFLLIGDALESARACRLAPGSLDSDGNDWVGDWIGLAITLNEISRSLGTDDPYPFLLPEPVRQKLEFIDRLVRQIVLTDPS
jgi:hypothetical protein